MLALLPVCTQHTLGHYSIMGAFNVRKSRYGLRLCKAFGFKPDSPQPFCLPALTGALSELSIHHTLALPIVVLPHPGYAQTCYVWRPLQTPSEQNATLFSWKQEGVTHSAPANSATGKFLRLNSYPCLRYRTCDLTKS